MVDTRLFRSEALQFTGQSYLGQVTLDAPLPLSMLGAFLVGLFVLVATYLVFGEYARKETVSGYLDTDHSVVRIFPDGERGVIDQLYVDNGQRVEKGTILLKVNYPRTMADGDSSNAETLAELQRQKEQLLAQHDQGGQIHLGRMAHLRSRLAATEKELQQQLGFESLQRARIEVDASLLAALEKLRAGGGISESSWLRARAEKLEQEKEMVRARQRITRLQTSLKDLEQQLRQLPAEHSKQELQIEFQISSVQQKIVALSTRSSQLVIAPISGQVSGLQVAQGMVPSPRVPLMSLIPQHASLKAVLLIPSAAIGFVETGQPVRMMLDAFPHQQFGTHSGVLGSVSGAPTAAADLRAPINPAGPVFIATADLETSTFSAMGEQRLLQPGMLLKADIVLERRSLFAWLMEPLYSLRGRG